MKTRDIEVGKDYIVSQWGGSKRLARVLRIGVSGNWVAEPVKVTKPDGEVTTLSLESGRGILVCLYYDKALAFTGWDDVIVVQPQQVLRATSVEEYEAEQAARIDAATQGILDRQEKQEALLLSWRSVFGDRLPPGVDPYDLVLLGDGVAPEEVVSILQAALWAVSTSGEGVK